LIEGYPSLNQQSTAGYQGAASIGRPIIWPTTGRIGALTLILAC
jgi:hypothetical protein